MTDAPPFPSTFTDAERALWQARYRGAARILEYGAGESTRFAAANGLVIRTQESDPRWVATLSAEPIVADAIAAGTCRLVHADIGKVENWGYPDNLDDHTGWADYVLSPWREAEAFDLVLVDGRFRVAATLAAILHAPAGATMMMHDFWNRPHYHTVLDHLEVLERADTLAVFRSAQPVDRAVLSSLLEQYLTDPE